MRQFSSLALAALIATSLRAEGASSEVKISFQRVNQAAEAPHGTGDVSGTWVMRENGSAKSFLPYLILRQKAGTFIGSIGPHEQLQAPLLDLSVRDGVVRFTAAHWNVELTLKDDRLLEGRRTQPVLVLGPLSRKFAASLNDPSIEYWSTPGNDAVSEFNRRIQAGEVRLTRDSTHGYLQSVLDAFHVPIESQVAVFSKTSLQRERINPGNPRAIFFNDEVSIGWIRGGELIEVAAQDPQQGIAFYTLDQKRTDNAQFERGDRCLGCHLEGGVPGLMVSSVVPMPNGRELPIADSVGPVDHRTPLERRWGGWYVTGKHGFARHLGNAVATDSEQPLSMVSDATLNLESLEGRFDTHAYPSLHSDIAALMVLDHQVHMTNLLTRMGWETRLALHQEQLMKNSPDYHPDPDLLAQRLGDAAREFVDYLLFIDEVTLTGKIQGTSGFAQKFAAQGPRDGQGRSLRQFDLEKRLFRYPCSYLIYSRAFDGLPAEAKEAIYARMWQVLSGEEKGDRYARLSLSYRQDIVEILRETKKGLPAYFQSVVQ